MNLADKQIIQAIFIRNKISPKKSFGQNFLIDEQVLNQILKAANLEKPDRKSIILEIGPGIGVLTAALIEKAGKVIAVEADHEMVGVLKKVLNEPSNLTVVPAAIQHFRRDEYFQDGQYKIVANIPYNISSYLLNDYLQNSPRPSEMILMLQEEVAERAIAKPGDSERSLLSLVVELFSKKAEIIEIIPSTAFWPAPKVESAILKIIVRADTLVRPYDQIIRIAKIAFSQRRKKIANSLPIEMRGIASLHSDIDLNLRPQDLTLEQWKAISTL